MSFHRASLKYKSVSGEESCPPQGEWSETTREWTETQCEWTKTQSEWTETRCEWTEIPSEWTENKMLHHLKVNNSTKKDEPIKIGFILSYR